MEGLIYTLHFDLIKVPVVKNVVVLNEIARGLTDGATVLTLDTEMPFDIYNTAFTDLATGTQVMVGNITTIDSSDYIYNCFGTMTGNLGVVINGDYEEPTEVN